MNELNTTKDCLCNKPSCDCSAAAEACCGCATCACEVSCCANGCEPQDQE